MRPCDIVFGLAPEYCVRCVILSLTIWYPWVDADAAGLRSEVVVSTGLTQPVFAAAPTDDFDHLYVAEQGVVRLKMLDLATNQLMTVLNLPNVDPSTGQETGLNGFAFHPDHANNGKIYLQVSGNELPSNIRILEFTRSAENPNVFDPASEREVLVIPNPAHSHNGGWIGFGPDDGYLYVATGDGGNIGTSATKGLPAQDVDDVRGKMLRIDVNGDDFPDDLERNYSIPETNPFADGGGAPEVFALGLRHAYRNSFDRGTGDLYIGDVGDSRYEEVNFLPAGTDGGQNFGWRPREGFFDNPDWPDPAPPDAIDPIYAYAHGFSAAVIGGYVYRGADIPWLQGTYFFGDFIKRTIFSFRYDGAEITEFTDRTLELTGDLDNFGNVASYAEDAAGELYMVDRSGRIFRITAVPPVELGDYNLNGIVDAADYTIWRDMFGQEVEAGTAADGDLSGVIDSGDYSVWRENFGHPTTAGGSGGTAGVTPVPEPSSLLCVAATLICSIVSVTRYRTHVAPTRPTICG